MEELEGNIWHVILLEFNNPPQKTSQKPLRKLCSVCDEGFIIDSRVRNRFSKFLFGDTWSYLPTPPLGQDVTQGQFLSDV